jgi:ABC-type multidrug transport system fused ATPase/permease subunit
MPINAETPLSWAFVTRALRRHKKKLIEANLIAVFATLAAIPVPLLLPLMVDEVLLNRPGALVGFMNDWLPEAWRGPVAYIGIVLAVTVALRLTSVLLNVWQTRNFSLASKEIVYRIRRHLLDRLERIALSEYETLGSGTVTSHFVTDINAIDNFLGASVSGVLVAALSLLGTSAVLFWMHWPLAMLILVLNPPVIFFSTRLGRRVKDLKKKENSAFELFQQSLAETLDALHQIRAMNRERHYLARVMDKAGDIRRHAAAFAWKSDAVSRLSFFVFLAGFDLFRAVAMLMVVFSDLSIGQMLAVFGYLWYMMSPVQELISIQHAWFAASGALGRINRLLGLREADDFPCRNNPFQNEDTVGLSLDHVTFRYGEGPPVLDNVSLDIAAGEKVALVGASGGGKSTLVQVLLGLYPLDRGCIRYGGVPVSEIGWQTVREHVGVVLQHPVLFNDSLRSNLTLGRDIPDQRLWWALKVTQLQVWCKALPERLDTLVGRQGMRLSGGQRQRLAIARLLLGDPAAVILDEATSALDTVTERHVLAGLSHALGDRTQLIIAHRLSAVRQADRVVVFDGGQVVEEGDHDSLMQRGGIYHKLYGQHVR